MGHKDNENRIITRGDPGSAHERTARSWLVFSDEDAEKQRIKRARTAGAAALAVLMASILVFVLIGRAQNASSNDLSALLERDGSEKDVELLLHMDYKGSSLQKELNISVVPQRVDASAADKLFDECELWIESQLRQGIAFPDEGPGGVSITWQDQDFSYIGIDGPTDCVLVAQLGAGEYTRVSEFTVTLDPSAEDYLRSMDALSASIAEDLSEDAEGASLALPEETDGVALSWSASKAKAPYAVIAAGLFSALFIWLSRNDAAEKLLKKRREQIERELPNVIFQMILYLNAGLIAESAFVKLAEQSSESRHPMYRALRDVRSAAEKKNVSFVSELYAYAKASDSADLIRFASLAYEHAGRGSELAGKLEQERDQMWSLRVTGARAKVKEAETKLCFPLMLLLLALILITAAPSFMNM